MAIFRPLSSEPVVYLPTSVWKEFETGEISSVASKWVKLPWIIRIDKGSYLKVRERRVRAVTIITYGTFDNILRSSKLSRHRCNY